MPRRALMIQNPRAGSPDVHVDLAGAREYLRAHDWSIDWEVTREPGHARRLAEAAAVAGLDVVLIAGGDGTLNEAVNALVGTRTAIGVLPCGTANVWARQLGLPLSSQGLLDAARLLAEARTPEIDVGRVTTNVGSAQATTRYFLLWSGLGLDAYVARSLEPRPVSFKRWGAIGYSLAALRAALAYRGVQADLEVDGQRRAERVVLIVVSNAPLYAGYFHLASDAQVDDGWLEVNVLAGHGFLAAAGHFARLLLRRYWRDPHPATVRARRVRVTTRGVCHVHVDAEPIGTTPVEIGIVPRALRALTPASAPASLFTSSQEAR